MGIFHTVGDDSIKSGNNTDIYFIRTTDILALEGKNPMVHAEITAGSLPAEWGVFCGFDDVLSLLEGLPVDLYAMPEGSIFYPGEPVIRISGHYRDFAKYETSLLGFICHASGIASSAAMIKACAAQRPVYSFGSRRQHPAISGMIERSAWIGGVDGSSNICAPPGIPQVGTMPHAFVMCYDKPLDAWLSFDRHAPADVPRVMLCDTYCDEKREALEAAKAGASAVRLDTPASRKGNMRDIIEEVRWELDINGFSDVGIFLSGGLCAEDILKYRDIVDAFGVGGSIANAPVIDFSMDIVEIEGKIYSKRGRKSGVKEVYEFDNGDHLLLPKGVAPPEDARPMMKNFMKDGQILSRPDMQKSRARVLASIEKMI